MSYTPDSPLAGYRPPAPQWAPTLDAHRAVGGGAMIVATYDLWCRTLALDADLALAQACHEATWFTSIRWRDEFNPAGLGITATDTPPDPFRSPAEGIRAHCEHLCAYVYTRDACPADHAHLADRRHTFHEGLPTLAGLEARLHWADPGTGYVDAIATLANQVVGADAPTVPPPGPPPVVSAEDYPTRADLGWDVEIEATDFMGPERPLSDIDWTVTHDTEGHFRGDVGVLTHGSRSGSVHFIIGRERGQYVASVPIRFTAWTAGNDRLGARAIQVELSKAPDEDGYTDWQYEALAATYRWCEGQGTTVPRVYLGLHPADADGGILPDRRGYIGHAGVPDGFGGWGGFAHHTDPGPSFDWPRLLALMDAAAPPVVPPGPPADLRTFPETGRGISGNIKGYWERFGDDAVSIDVFGYPVTDQVDEGGAATQYFQRAVLVDAGGRVEGRLLGAAAAKAAGHAGPGID